MSAQRQTGRLQSILGPPVIPGADTEAASRARTLHYLAIGMMLVVSALLGIIVLLQPAMLERALISFLVVNFAGAVCLVLNKAGRTRAATWLLVSLLLLLVLGQATQAGGVRSPGIQAFFIFGLVAAVLIGEKAGVLVCIACMAGGLMLAGAETLGFLPERAVPYSPMVLWLINSIYICIFLMLVHQYTRTLTGALALARAELAERRRAEQKLELTLAAGNFGVFEQDLATRNFRGDGRSFDLLKLPAAPDHTLPFETWKAMVDPADRPAITRSLADLAVGAAPVQIAYRIARSDGVRRHLEVAAAAVRDEQGVVTGIVGMVRDATERLLLVRDLGERVKELKLLHATAHLLQGASEINRALIAEFATMIPSAWLHVDCCAARVRYDDMVAQTPNWRDSRWKMSAPFRVGEVDGGIEVVYLDERPREFEGPFLAEERALLESLAEMFAARLKKDQSERQRLAMEVQLRHTQKMDAIGRLAGGIAHDFNNLLTAIIGYAELLKLSLKEGDAGRGDVEEIIRVSKRATRLTRQLLTFSRKQVLKPEVLDLEAVIEDMAGMLRRIISEDIVLELKPVETPSLCLADRGLLEQVVLNLVVNAHDAMPDGGRVSISTSIVDIGVEEAAELNVQAGRYVRLRVSDTGPGMSEEIRRQIFEPFFTTKEKGTGLGLATVYGIVRQSRGGIRVQSEEGLGAEFEIHLPAASAGQAEAALQSRPEPEAAGNAVILIVDDDENILAVSRRALSAAGFSVVATSNVVEVLRLISDPREPVDLLLSDIVMPGMNGFDLVRHARMKRPGLRVLFMSGYHDKAQQPQDAVDVVCLQKPFTVAELAEAVRTALDTNDASIKPSPSAAQGLGEDGNPE